MEVVVVDNASPDDTIEQLGLIKDERLRVIRNEENIGGSRNLVKSLYAAQGKFCLYCNDRDIIYPEKLSSFIDFLKDNPSVGGGHCVRNKLNGGGDFIDCKGVKALLTINFRGEHPTGFFFRRELLDQIPKDSVERYSASEPYTPFPYENLLCEIICKGYTVGQYNEVIWRSTGNETHNKYVSGFVKLEEKGDRWFYPGNCLRRTIGNTEDTLRLCQENNISLTEEEKYRLYAHLVVNQYKYGVFRYKQTYETPSLAIHYAVNYHKVSRKELNQCRKEIRDGYLDYIRSKNGVNEQYEHIITTAIDDSDRQWRRQRTIGRVLAFLSKVKHTLMGR
jgi:glycosyltransferase involved in cell wall biosynthesis